MENVKKMKNAKVGRFILNYAVIILIAVSAILVGIFQENFLSASNLKNLLVNTSVRFIIALGVSGCLIMRNNDLSAGRQAGLAACIAAIFLQSPDYSERVLKGFPVINMWVVLLILMILFAVTFGLINGLIVSVFHVPAFIGTYGMQTVVYGIALIVTGAKPIGGLLTSYTDMCSGSLFGIQPLSNLAVIALIVGIVIWFLYNKTPYGKRMYAIGGNGNAAEVSGINTTKMTIISYMIASALYALAGFMMGGKAGGTSASLGASYELFAIAGCTIGGVSVNGGIGTVPGILTGVLVFEVLKIEMQFMGIDTAYTYIVQGVVIIVAIALDIRKYIAKK